MRTSDVYRMIEVEGEYVFAIERERRIEQAVCSYTSFAYDATSQRAVARLAAWFRICVFIVAGTATHVPRGIISRVLAGDRTYEASLAVSDRQKHTTSQWQSWHTAYGEDLAPNRQLKYGGVEILKLVY